MCVREDPPFAPHTAGLQLNTGSQRSLYAYTAPPHSRRLPAPGRRGGEGGQQPWCQHHEGATPRRRGGKGGKVCARVALYTRIVPPCGRPQTATGRRGAEDVPVRPEHWSCHKEQALRHASSLAHTHGTDTAQARSSLSHGQAHTQGLPQGDGGERSSATCEPACRFTQAVSVLPSFPTWDPLPPPSQHTHTHLEVDGPPWSGSAEPSAAMERAGERAPACAHRLLRAARRRRRGVCARRAGGPGPASRILGGGRSRRVRCVCVHAPLPLSSGSGPSSLVLSRRLPAGECAVARRRRRRRAALGSASRRRLRRAHGSERGRRDWTLGGGAASCTEEVAGARTRRRCGVHARASGIRSDVRRQGDHGDGRRRRLKNRLVSNDVLLEMTEGIEWNHLRVQMREMVLK